MLVVAFVPFREMIPSKDEVVELVVPLRQVLKAISHRLLHNVEKDVVWIRILESFTDKQGVEQDLTSMLK